MCLNKEKTQPLLVSECFRPFDLKICSSASMRDAGGYFSDAVSVIPVVEFSGELVGTLYKDCFVEFLIAYFENLTATDRGNEFMFDGNSPNDIHFVPIDQVSRYMTPTSESIPNDVTAEKAEEILWKLGRSSLLVADGEDIVGCISMFDIVNGRRNATAECCKRCKSKKQTDETYSL